ncbi:MAG: preprotein translocase subunit SecG [Parcubacteria group bacterium]|jgi:protein translocase SecG subunit|nr:preprotein translocase subunit SecG [Parcubacteria group bacterium]|tara:strand:- start:10919 stop:11149 length:231 start_codon:yes stop_codon:yes gene_type:complete
MQSILTIAQIAISLALIVTILLQKRGAGGSSILGGGGGGGGGASYYTKRGFEKILFVSSIILAGLFLITAFLNLII